MQGKIHDRIAHARHPVVSLGIEVIVEVFAPEGGDGVTTAGGRAFLAAGSSSAEKVSVGIASSTTAAQSIRFLRNMSAPKKNQDR